MVGKYALIVILFAGVTACKSSESVSEANTETETQAEVQNAEELEDLYWARKDSAKMTFTQADVDFMLGMIPHHAQALIMSRLAPVNNAGPEVQKLASRIINSQKDEIESMQTWLRERGQPVPEVHIEGLNLMIHGLGDHHQHMDHTKMAGMLSQEQLVELSEATGKEFDRLFLKYMIGHHKGAVTMVTKLFETDGAAQEERAFRLATDIQVDQRTEIARMQLMLDNLTASTEN